MTKTFHFNDLPPETKQQIVDQYFFDDEQHPEERREDAAQLSLVSKELRHLCAKHLFQVRPLY
jgi:hypothetical protein